MRKTRLGNGILAFPTLTQLDLTGPYEILARLPGAETLWLWKSLDPVRSERGLTILPMATLASCPPLDLILAPDGAGINPFARRCRGSRLFAPPRAGYQRIAEGAVE